MKNSIFSFFFVFSLLFVVGCANERFNDDSTDTPPCEEFGVILVEIDPDATFHGGEILQWCDGEWVILSNFTSSVHAYQICVDPPEDVGVICYGACTVTVLDRDKQPLFVWFEDILAGTTSWEYSYALPADEVLGVSPIAFVR